MESTAEKNVITVASTIGAPVEKVWQYWTSPEHITKWNFASDDWQCPHAENDLRVGGQFSSRMEARDGSMGFDFAGTYTEVEKHKRIAYAMEDGRTVQIRFEPDGAGTRVTESFDAENTHPADMQQAGWQAILDNFKKYTEAGPALQTMHFEMDIEASADKVYRIMLDQEQFSAWTAAFNPTSRFEGSWEKGAKIRFVGDDKDGTSGGMVSRIKENIPNKFVSIEHLGVIHNGTEVTSGPDIDGWAGALENYTFTERDGKTTVGVDLDVNDEFRSYFSDTWPKALQLLKEICEAEA